MYDKKYGSLEEQFKVRYYCITRTDLNEACKEIEQLLQDGWKIAEKHYWEDRFIYVYRKSNWKRAYEKTDRR